LRHQLDELGEGSAQTIEAPDDDECVVGADVLKRLGESMSVCLGGARRIAKDLLALGRLSAHQAAER
jgi:hypothetical protein